MYGFTPDHREHCEYVKVPVVANLVVEPPEGMYSAKNGGVVRFDILGLAAGGLGFYLLDQFSQKIFGEPVSNAGLDGISAAVIMVPAATEVRGPGGSGGRGGTISGAGDMGGGGGGAGNVVGFGGAIAVTLPPDPPHAGNPGVAGTDGAGGAGGTGVVDAGRTATYSSSRGVDGGTAIQLGAIGDPFLNGPEGLFLSNLGKVWGGGGGGAPGNPDDVDGNAGGAPGVIGVANSAGNNGLAGHAIKQVDGNTHTATLLIGGSSPDLEGTILLS